MLELLVALLATSLVASAALSVTLSTRSLVVKDQSRVRVDHDLRIGLELLGVEIRQAGERLPADFPAMEVVDGAGGAPDRLIIRRNLLDTVLPVCKRIMRFTNTTEVRIAKDVDDPPQGCAPVPDTDADGWPENLAAWRAYRDANGGTVPAYVYNPVRQWGEFFVFDGDGSSTQYIHKADTGMWNNAYRVNQQCRIYLLEERVYELSGGVLRIIVNGDTAGALNVLSGVTDFQLRAVLDDASVVDSFGVDDEWKSLSAIDVTVSAKDEVQQQIVTRTVSSRFFPRNVLSL